MARGGAEARRAERSRALTSWSPPLGAIVTIVNCHADMIFDSEEEGRGAVKEKKRSASSSLLFAMVDVVPRGRVSLV